MKKKLFLFISFVLLIALMAYPVQAADQTINLIDQNGSTWTNNEANGNAITVDFSGGKLVATAPGSWPWVTSTLNTPIVLSEADNATIHVKFKVEDATGATSIRLVVGADSADLIYLHHFIPNVTFDGSGDVGPGEYELTAKVFDLQAFDGNADNQWIGKKALPLVDGKLTIGGIQVWCSGASTSIKVTVEKLEVIIPGAASDTSSTASTSSTAASSQASSSKTSSSAPTTGDNGIVGLVLIALFAATTATVYVSKKRS